jgi:hypothetical protein
MIAGIVIGVVGTLLIEAALVTAFFAVLGGEAR